MLLQMVFTKLSKMNFTAFSCFYSLAQLRNVFVTDHRHNHRYFLGTIFECIY